MGIEAGWYRSMEGYNSSINSNATSYVLNALFKAYYCNRNVNKMLLGGETGTWFYVWVNKFSWFVQPVVSSPLINNPFTCLTPKEGEFKGYPLYKGLHNENSNTGMKYSRAIIITRKGQSPYVAVTRKQYLQAFLNYNQKKLPEELASIEKNTPVKTHEQEEANKKIQLDRIEKTTAPARVAKAKESFLQGLCYRQATKGEMDCRYKKKI